MPRVHLMHDHRNHPLLLLLLLHLIIIIIIISLVITIIIDCINYCCWSLLLLFLKVGRCARKKWKAMRNRALPPETDKQVFLLFLS